MIEYINVLCGYCSGTGKESDSSFKCEVCNGQGSVLAAKPARPCATCEGTGKTQSNSLCEACGGSGWSNTFYESNNHENLRSKLIEDLFEPFEIKVRKPDSILDDLLD